MKHLSLFLFCLSVGFISSCDKSTDSDSYDSKWSPYSETKWVKTGGPGDFSGDNGGFSFSASIADTGTYKFTFIPSIYVVSNISSAKDAYITFKAKVTSAPDTVKLVAGGIQLNQFGVVSGSIQTKGADSISTSAKPFVGEVPVTFPLSISPDSCSREIKFNVTVDWKKFTGGATLDTLRKKKVTIEFTDVTMQVNGIKVLSQ